MKALGLMLAVLFGSAAPAYADTILLDDPLHGMVCTGTGTGCTNADNGNFTPLGPGQFTNWGFGISPGPGTGNLNMVILVPTNSINTATFNLPGLNDNGTAVTTSVFSRTTLFNAGSADLPTYLGLANASSYSPTDNFSNASAGEATENPGFSGNFLAFTAILTGIKLDDVSSTTLTNDFGFASSLPNGTVFVGLFNELIDKKGNSVDNFVGTAASGDLVTGSVPTTPIPGALWLFGSGLLGLIGFGRKWAIPAA